MNIYPSTLKPSESACILFVWEPVKHALEWYNQYKLSVLKTFLIGWSFPLFHPFILWRSSTAVLSAFSLYAAGYTSLSVSWSRIRINLHAVTLAPARCEYHLRHLLRKQNCTADLSDPEKTPWKLISAWSWSVYDDGEYLLAPAVKNRLFLAYSLICFKYINGKK